MTTSAADKRPRSTFMQRDYADEKTLEDDPLALRNRDFSDRSPAYTEMTPRDASAEKDLRHSGECRHKGREPETQ